MLYLINSINNTIRSILILMRSESLIKQLIQYNTMQIKRYARKICLDLFFFFFLVILFYLLLLFYLINSSDSSSVVMLYCIVNSKSNCYLFCMQRRSCQRARQGWLCLVAQLVSGLIFQSLTLHLRFISLYLAWQMHVTSFVDFLCILFL